MSEMVGKIPLQEKIAELESRIAKLESERQVRTTTTTTKTVIHGNPFGAHWDSMWSEFNLMMKDVFKHE